MSKSCLIIDDNLQDDVIEKIERKFKKGNHFGVKCYQFNVGSLERKDLMTNEAINIDKVLEIFDLEFKSIKLDLICIDYNLEDDITGLDILNKIYPSRRHASYMMYSSNLEQLVKHIIGNYDADKDKKRLLTRIKSLTRHKIDDFVGRDNYDEAVINWMLKSPQTLESIVEEKLLEYPDLVFQNTFPNFQGKTLKQIAHEIRVGSPNGDSYMKELIEQAISNMILINPYY